MFVNTGNAASVQSEEKWQVRECTENCWIFDFRDRVLTPIWEWTKSQKIFAGQGFPLWSFKLFPRTLQPLNPIN